jgi:hypothetical protein
VAQAHLDECNSGFKACKQTATKFIIGSILGNLSVEFDLQLRQFQNDLNHAGVMI